MKLYEMGSIFLLIGAVVAVILYFRVDWKEEELENEDKKIEKRLDRLEKKVTVLEKKVLAPK